MCTYGITAPLSSSYLLLYTTLYCGPESQKKYIMVLYLLSVPVTYPLLFRSIKSALKRSVCIEQHSASDYRLLTSDSVGVESYACQRDERDVSILHRFIYLLDVLSLCTI